MEIKCIYIINNRSAFKQWAYLYNTTCKRNKTVKMLDISAWPCSFVVELFAIQQSSDAKGLVSVQSVPTLFYKSSQMYLYSPSCSMICLKTTT